MGYEGFPLILGWELTLSCNLRCMHCASSAGSPRQDELSLGEALAICDQLPSLFVQEVDFTGGEPLLSPLWQPLALRLREYGIVTRLISNGLALAENAEALASAGIAGVGVSIDGLPRTHDEIRARPGLFGRAMEGIGALQRAGVSASAITAVSDRNIGELEELEGLLASVGIENWQIQPIFSRGRAKEHESLSLSERNFVRLCEFAHREGLRAGGMKVLAADGIGYLSSLDSGKRPWTGCHAGVSSCGIMSNGLVKGCLSLPDSMIEGNLRERDLWDIWFSDSAFAYTRGFSPIELGEHCASCPEGERCKGGCSVMSHSSTDRFHDDPYCVRGIEARRVMAQ